MHNTIAVIPARGGSKGIPNKNIIPLCGHPLIAYSIILAKQCSQINRIIVSTDSDKIAQVAKKYGAEVPFMRPSNISKDNSTDLQWLSHFIEWYDKNHKTVLDSIIMLRPTTPIRDSLKVSSAITYFNKMKDISKTTSLRSAHLIAESPFKYFRKDNNYWKGFMLSDTEQCNLPRQNFIDAYKPDGYIDIVLPSEIKKGSVFGKKILAFETPPQVTEIDSLEEKQYLEYAMKDEPILACLNKYFTS